MAKHQKQPNFLDELVPCRCCSKVPNLVGACAQAHVNVDCQRNQHGRQIIHDALMGVMMRVPLIAHTQIVTNGVLHRPTNQMRNQKGQ